VIDERSGFEEYGVGIADWVLFKEQELRLRAPLPLRDVLKAFDVSPDEPAQLGRRLLRSGKSGGVLQGDLAMLGQRSAALRCVNVLAS
jgi:hypothetical protein